MDVKGSVVTSHSLFTEHSIRVKSIPEAAFPVPGKAKLQG